MCSLSRLSAKKNKGHWEMQADRNKIDAWNSRILVYLLTHWWHPHIFHYWDTALNRIHQCWLRSGNPSNQVYNHMCIHSCHPYMFRHKGMVMRHTHRCWFDSGFLKTHEIDKIYHDIKQNMMNLSINAVSILCQVCKVAFNHRWMHQYVYKTAQQFELAGLHVLKLVSTWLSAGKWQW